MLAHWKPDRQKSKPPAATFAVLTTIVLVLLLGSSPDISRAQEERLEQTVSRQTWRHSPATQTRRERFRQTVEELASPDYAGRAPGTHGGTLTTEYLVRQFEAAGLTPPANHSSLLQSVRLTRFRTQAALSVSPLNKPPATTIDSRQFVAWSDQRDKRLSFQGQPVFAGYGIQAAEFDWDDYQGLDVNGRIVLLLIGEPPSEDPAWFAGKSMSRHGRWDQKLTVAARQGAAAVILVHDSKAAGYPFSAVANTYGQQRINLSDPQTAREEPPLSVWISAPGADALLAGTDTGLNALKLMARGRNESPHPELALQIQLTADIEHETFESFNVVGQLAGMHKQMPGPAPIALVAHWDHLGPVIDERTGKATSYYPGAADNASGVAQMLDVAHHLARRTERIRPVVFVALTAEESGMLGSRQYVKSFAADDPNRPVAALNIDVANVFGRAQDIEVIGLGLSSLDLTLSAVARDMQRRVSPDYAPAIGRLYRSDQYEFIRHGIPAVWVRGGRKSRTFSMSSPINQIRQYLREGYHQTGDTVRRWWEIDAALEDANLIAEALHRLSNQAEQPAFNLGSPYSNRR